MNKLILVFLSLGLTACSMIQTHPRRGPIGNFNQEVALDFEKERRQQEFRQTRDELGLMGKADLTEYQVRSIENRVALNRLERSLKTEVEKQQYFTYKPYFKNDRERRHFLSLPTLEDRERYASERGLGNAARSLSKKEMSAIEAADVYLGMSRKAVRDSWGDPETVEIAGNPVYGNERWQYSDYQASSDGYQLERRVIYFEGGRVVGWEKR